MAVDKDRLIHAGGFAFQDAEEGDKASHELEAVEYIEDTMNWQDSDQVLKLYLQILDSGMFTTPVGLSFLRDIQRRLLDGGQIDPYQIPDVPVPVTFGHVAAGIVAKQGNAELKETDAMNSSEEDETALRLRDSDRLLNAMKKRNVKHRRSIQMQKVMIGILVIMVILMFVISLTGRAPTILNYRSKVQNEYSEWEEELKAREDLIREREHELGISEEDK